jgi:acyl carrier protein
MSREDQEPLTLREALNWLADVFAERPAAVAVDTPREDLPGWDSMGQLVLMAGLDERFDIRLSDDELGHLKSIKDILDILRLRGRLLED